MKFTASKAEIVNALSATLGVVEKRQAIEILSNVLLVVGDDNQITVTATDTESEIKTHLKALRVETTGQTTAPANKLNELCKLLPDGSEITIYLNNNKLFIESGSGKYSISTLPSEDFPAFNLEKSGAKFSVPAQTLKHIINKTFFAIDATARWDRPYLTGLLLKTEEQHLTAASTDAHRLATTSKPLKNQTNADATGLIPRKAVAEIGKLLVDLNEDVLVDLSKNTIKVEAGLTTLSSKLIATKFPIYERIIPSGDSNLLEVNTKDLSDVIRRVRVFSDHNEKPILLQITSDKVTVSTAGRNQEEAKESINAKYDGGDIEIAFKSNYLQDIFTHIESEVCNIHLFGEDENCLITSPCDPNFKCVLMPLLFSN